MTQFELTIGTCPLQSGIIYAKVRVRPQTHSGTLRWDRCSTSACRLSKKRYICCSPPSRQERRFLLHYNSTSNNSHSDISSRSPLLLCVGVKKVDEEKGEDLALLSFFKMLTLYPSIWIKKRNDGSSIVHVNRSFFFLLQAGAERQPIWHLSRACFLFEQACPMTTKYICQSSLIYLYIREDLHSPWSQIFP